MANPVDAYAFRAIFSKEDREYVGLCAAFPSLSFLAETEAAALDGIRALVAEVLVEMNESGEVAPSAEPAARYRVRATTAMFVETEVEAKDAAEARERALARHVLGRCLQCRSGNPSWAWVPVGEMLTPDPDPDAASVFDVLNVTPPSAASLAKLPELDVSSASILRRGPREPMETRGVRLTAAIWARVTERAGADGKTLHDAVREALEAWATAAESKAT